MKLHVTMRGQGFPVLCLHGHPGNGQTMSVFTDFLSQRFWTIAPDLRGYGKSRTKQPFTMQDHLTDLEELLNTLDIERCLLLGWSLGGILALELALKYPERFSGLILVASAAQPRGSHPPITTLDLFYTALAGGINWLKPGWSWNIKYLGARSLFRYLIGTPSKGTYHYLAQEGVQAYLQTSKPAEKALTQALKQRYNRLSHLGELSLPCLVLAGEKDRHITAESSQETAQHLTHCQWCCYPNVAHLFPWEIPTQVIMTLEDWLKKHHKVP